MQSCHACTAILASPGCVFFPVRFTHLSHQQNAKQNQNGSLPLGGVRPVRVPWCRDSPANTSLKDSSVAFGYGTVPGGIIWMTPGHAHRAGPEGSTLRCVNSLSSWTFMLHLCCIKSLQVSRRTSPNHQIPSEACSGT